MATEIVIFSLFAISINLLIKYIGLVSFGHAAFFGVGAYIVAIVLKSVAGFPLFGLLLLSIGSAVLLAAIIGFFSVRSSPSYFPLLVLAFQMLLLTIAMKWRSLTGGDDGMPIIRPDFYLPIIGEINLIDSVNMYYLSLVIVIMALFLVYLALKTPLGNAFLCTKINPSRASHLGYNILLIRWIAFVLSGAMAGLAGGLYVIFQEFVATTTMDLHMSFTAFMMVLIGGTAYYLGPVLGVTFYILMTYFLSDITPHWQLYLGVMFIIIVKYSEGGLVGLIEKLRDIFSHTTKEVFNDVNT